MLLRVRLQGSRSAFQSNFTQQSLWNKVEYAHFRRYRVRIEHLQCQVLQVSLYGFMSPCGRLYTGMLNLTAANV